MLVQWIVAIVVITGRWSPPFLTSRQEKTGLPQASLCPDTVQMWLCLPDFSAQPCRSASAVTSSGGAQVAQAQIRSPGTAYPLSSIFMGKGSLEERYNWGIKSTWAAARSQGRWLIPDPFSISTGLGSQTWVGVLSTVALKNLKLLMLLVLGHIPRK